MTTNVRKFLALTAGILLASQAIAADEPQFSYVNIGANPDKEPAITALWDDYTKTGAERWKKEGGFDGKPFPANVLTAHLKGPNGPVLVSAYMSLYDCEMPGGDSLIAKCPLRVQYGEKPNIKLKTVDGACWVYIDPADVPGPDPAANHLTAELGADGKSLTIGAVENGSSVAECTQTIALD